MAHPTFFVAFLCIATASGLRAHTKPDDPDNTDALIEELLESMTMNCVLGTGYPTALASTNRSQMTLQDLPRSEPALQYSCTKCIAGTTLLTGPPPINGDRKVAEDLFAKHGMQVITHCAKPTHKIIAVRHGQSRWNKVAERFGTWAQTVGLRDKYKDSPLSDLGLRQAQRLANLIAKATGGKVMRHEVDLEQVHLAQRAMTELTTSDLERLAQIEHEGEPLSDEALVAALRQHKEELQILSGQLCGTTNFVSSQLVRAMDTLNLVLLEATTRCNATWQIHSNMQEFEHNADCDARTGEHMQPSISLEETSNELRRGQRDQYYRDQMQESLAYMKYRYEHSDVSRFTKNLAFSERNRVRLGDYDDFKALIQDELAYLYNTGNTGKGGMTASVMGGHSIWFRYMFRYFGDPSDEVCKELASVKIANAGVASADLMSVDDEDTPFRLVNCKWVHLGDSKKYKYVEHFTPTTVQPHEEDFRFGTKHIAGWQCCCWLKNCYLVYGKDESADPKALKCSDPETWGKVAGKEDDETFLPDIIRDVNENSRSPKNAYNWLEGRGALKCENVLR
eukprot:TRINITY_DN81298_c0_g1_i1.p1 TRINITY_DN81298_c0_g1~~TRINITY_DN81298_c0_g1_i1.p1  ORF type:complete len:566 (-),score=109.91 TRINITY_DN81298_c0_g1_i1:32-1729(-)